MKKIIKNIKKDFFKAPTALSEFHLEADSSPSGIKITVGGVKSVLDISEAYIEMKTVIGRLKFSGMELSLAVFLNKTVEISGRIDRVELLYGKI